MTDSPTSPRADIATPDRMRQAVADYVSEVHAAYVRGAGMLAPAAQGRLPLVAAGRFSVAAVGTRFLHLVATREVLGDVGSGTRRNIAQVEGGAEPLAWTLSFFDPVVVPGLGLVREAAGPAAEEVRRLLGIRTHLYHVTLAPPADLAPHHAGHTGAGLLGAHAAAARDYQQMRASVREERLAAFVDELEGADVAGLRHAAALLARELAPDDAEVARAAADLAADPAKLRRAVLRALRPARAGQPAPWQPDAGQPVAGQPDAGQPVAAEPVARSGAER